MPKTRPTSFLELSLELRQMMYHYILPADRIIYFPESQQRLEEEKTIYAVCAAAPEISEELVDLAFKERGAYILVSPDKEMGLPPYIEWDQFQQITVKIDHYQGHSRRFSWVGMKEIIASLRYGSPKILPDVTIRFHEDENCLRDVKWTKHVPIHRKYRYYVDPNDSDFEDGPSWRRYEDGVNELLEDNLDEKAHAWLRTTGDRYRNPIVVDILDHFLALPPCKSALVYPVGGLEKSMQYLPRHDPKRRIFDQDYMNEICEELELWLKGDRDGIDLDNEGWDHGLPNLEQIAWRKYKECERG